MNATYEPYILYFKQPSGTSRGVLHQKKCYFIHLTDNSGKTFTGECGLLEGLSIDDLSTYEQTLQWVCDHINEPFDKLYTAISNYPSIQFGLEQVFLLQKNNGLFFPSSFTQGKKSIQINGLIWMGDQQFMQQQIDAKLVLGFSCIKIKISKSNFNQEYDVLKKLRKKNPALEIRVDANGAFTYQEAKIVLQQLAKLTIHSIEQPIPVKQEEMAKLSSENILPIALDEELIGVKNYIQKKEILSKIKPQYIILKPSLLGGFKACDEWIQLANELKIGWWLTSALESNIGLNAIAQYTYIQKNPLPQGLGTGGLYINNIATNLVLEGDQLFYKP